MSLQDVVRWLLPWETHFYDLLEQQAVVFGEATAIMASIAVGDAPQNLPDLLAKIAACEERGDDLVEQIQNALARTFVTPLDREDIHRLCAQFDDALDLAYLAMQAFIEHGAERWTAPMAELSSLLLQSGEVLQEATPQLRKHGYSAIIECGRRIQSLEKQGDRVFRQTLAELFRNPAIGAKELMREREILEGLENALDCCQDAADVLSNIAVKHG
jgi:uncharacterized protein Yka (UPF0111/DUF47 family)